MGRHHVGPCTAQAPPSARPLKLLPDEYKSRHDTCESQIRRTPIKSQALHTSTTMLYKKPCGTSVSCLSLTYKRRRRSPNRGHRFYPHSPTHSLS
jgi:hypothetical protein